MKYYKYKVGDKVIYKEDDLHFPEFFPPYGTIGIVQYYNADTDPDGMWIEWPAGSLAIPDNNDTSALDDNRTRVRYCKCSRVDPYEEGNE